MSASRQRGRAVIAIAAAGLSSVVPIALAPSAGRGAALAVGIALALVAAVLSLRRTPVERSARLWEARARLRQRMAALHESAKRDRLGAEEAQRDREEFLAAVSHELRTPLNSIQGFTQVLLSEIEGPLSPSQREDVDAIRTAGGYLKELIDEVLDASSRRTANEARLESIDLGEIVREVAKQLSVQRRDAPIAITFDVAADLPPMPADPRRVRQILLNLGGNALKFTHRGRVHLRAWAEHGAHRVSVEDSGPGIPKAELERIFRAFERVDTNPGRIDGWGLGLAIAREMAQWHAGRIEVVSEVGRGSTFTLVLPSSAGAGSEARP